MGRLGGNLERYEVIYRVSSDNAFEGIEVRELANVMYAFAETVQAALDETGNDGKKLEVHVKPFRQGSFIAEFVLTYGSPIANLFSGDEADTLSNVLTFLGFFGVSAATLPKIVRKVRGRIDQHQDNGDGTFTYGSGDDSVTVDGFAHRMIQSKNVAKTYKTVAVGPIVNIGGDVNITIQGASDFAAGDKSSGSHFTPADKSDIDAYAHIAIEGIPEEIEDIISTAHNVALVPCSGPYDGGENGYTFKCGDITYRKVQIHDLDFRLKLERGDVRLMTKDLLIANMNTVQSIGRSGKMSTLHTITEVVDYKPYVAEQQMTITDYLGSDN